MNSKNNTHNITCIIANFNTAHLVKTCVESFRKFYSTQIILIDNGSQDNSVEACQQLQQNYENIELILNEENVGHGPAMHQGILIADTPYIFTLDSDTETCKAGFLEKMLLKFYEQENLYAIGWLRYVNENGISGDHKINKSLKPYVHPYAMLFDRAKYLQLPQFVNSGAPCNLNMHGALDAGYTFLDFPIDKYINHLIAGTRRMYKGRWNTKNMDRGEWRENASYRI